MREIAERAGEGGLHIGHGLLLFSLLQLLHMLPELVEGAGQLSKARDRE